MINSGTQEESVGYTLGSSCEYTATILDDTNDVTTLTGSPNTFSIDIESSDANLLDSADNLVLRLTGVDYPSVQADIPFTISYMDGGFIEEEIDTEEFS